ncbi:MAG: hypothetical protein JSU63_15675 [Phycisphaerales bacterium]|nr:MAG: hypothetical protein JSU63_15675 [Phycisphaerales bacterium]
MSEPAKDVASEQSANVDVETAQVELIPPRYWWLKRLSILAIVVFVALVCLRWWWGWEANRRLEALIEHYHGAGQLVYAEEFDAELDAVPDDQNAAVLLERAMASVVSATQSGVQFTDFPYDPENLETNMPAARELMDANASVLDLVRQARNRPRAAWSSPIRGSFANPGSSLYSQQRNLAKLLWFSTSYDFLTGNHAEVVESFRDYLAFNEAIQAHPTLISNLIAWACHDLCFSLIEDFGSDLQVEGRQANSGAEARTATRAGVESLIEELLLEEGPRDALASCFLGERASQLEMIDYFGNGTLGPNVVHLSLAAHVWLSVSSFLYEPALKLEAIHGMRYCTAFSGLAAAPNWPMASRNLPKVNTPTSLPGLSAIECESRVVSLQKFFNTLARRRMAAIALAIRLYELDRGERPESLSDLVSDYLSEVPADPFASDGTTIRYIRDGEHPRLYSIGEDERDDGGVQKLRANGRIDFTHIDIIFYLDGKPKQGETGSKVKSPQAIEDDPNGVNDEGQSNESQGPQT